MGNDKHKPMSLITGGAGFIGSHVANHCLRLGHAAVVLDDLSGGFLDQVPSGAEFVQGSVTNSVLLTQLFQHYQFDYVYHLAAYAAEGLSHFIRRFNYTTNLIGTVNLINESVKAGVKCFVFTSSIAVYGSAPPPMSEDTVPIPVDPYGVSKYAAELDLRCAQTIFGLPYIIFRPHNVYGEHQNLGDPYRNVIGIFMRQIILGQALTVFGDGTQTRAFSHIDDVAPHIAGSVNIPESFGHVFNIGADQAYTVTELASVVKHSFRSDAPVQYLPARHEVLHAYASHENARSILGARARISLEEGVERMASWARRSGLRTSRLFTDVEVHKGMPASWADQFSTRGSPDPSRDEGVMLPLSSFPQGKRTR